MLREDTVTIATTIMIVIVMIVIMTTMITMMAGADTNRRGA
jgi:hypothetical protein